MRSLIIGLTIAAALSVNAAPVLADSASDKAAAQRIAEELKQSGQLRNYRVGVKYQDGVAWLSGSVTSEQQRQTALRLASNSAGVQHVVSKLDVAPPQFEVAQSLGNEQSKLEQVAATQPVRNARRNNMPLPMGAPIQQAAYGQQGAYGQQAGYGAPGGGMQPMPVSHVPAAVGQSVSYDQPQMPGYAWPSYAASPNYAALTYPKQYSPSAWPYIGPFYPYPQVPLGWRKVTLEWDDGWWFLDFKDCKHCN